MNVSDTRLKAILIQNNNNEKKKSIVYKTRTLNQNKQNYLTTKKECLAVV